MNTGHFIVNPTFQKAAGGSKTALQAFQSVSVQDITDFLNAGYEEGYRYSFTIAEVPGRRYPVFEKITDA